MARAGTFDDKRAHIASLASWPADEALEELRKALAEKNGYLVGDAAKMAEQLGLSALSGEMAAAFARLLIDPVKVDKGCSGKLRLVEALTALEARAFDVYLKGLAHRQLEPAFGPPVDTAAKLRGLCAHALVRFDHPEALLEIAPLLADPEPLARAEAASALASSGLDGAASLLHLRALTGESNGEVLGACYRGLLSLSPFRYLPFVAGVLADGNTPEAEVAAVALGESRLEGALAPLTEALSLARPGPLRDAALLGLSLLRFDEANQHLLSLVAEASEAQALEAIDALALQRHDARLSARLAQAVARRASPRLEAAYARRFAPR